MSVQDALIAVFHDAAEHVPAYRQILGEHGVDPAEVQTLEDFRRLVPVLDKPGTFGRFAVDELCRHGQLGRPAAVLTSSGHSGLFAFGLYDAENAEDELRRTDDALDMLFGVRSRATLMVNCLPMGVKVPTRACTLGDTSVRADVATALVGQFGPNYEQVILIGDTPFVKSVLELGRDQGLDWGGVLVQAIVGPLPESGRRYFESLLGIESKRPETGLVASSMGVAELGMNLFFELPELIALRRAIHQNRSGLHSPTRWPRGTVPSIFTYDPTRIFVESDSAGRLLVSTLDPQRRLPLLRYRTGDAAEALESLQQLQRYDVPAGTLPDEGRELPVVLFHGRGRCAVAGDAPVYPEAIQEGLYHDADLAGRTTANFRLRSGMPRASLRVQLSPNVSPGPALTRGFTEAICHFVPAPLEVRCEAYEEFGNGMSLDYERKFDYLDG